MFITRWYSSNGPAARLLRWLVLVLCLVTYGPVITLVTSVTCIHIQMSKYLHDTILFSQKSQFMVIHFYQEDNFSWEVIFLRKSHFPGSHM